MNINRLLGLLVPCAMALGTGCVGADDLEDVDTGAVEAVDESSEAIRISGTEWLLPTHGGNGGSYFEASCADGFAVVGFKGRAGWEMDRLQPICGLVNSNGTIGELRDGATFGGTGGTAFDIRCEPGQVVVGFNGRSGDRLDQLTMVCAEAGEWFGYSLIKGYRSLGGGTGGTFFGAPNDTCPAPYVIDRINLRAGSRIDRIQGVCSRLVE